MSMNLNNYIKKIGLKPNYPIALKVCVSRLDAYSAKGTVCLKLDEEYDNVRSPVENQKACGKKDNNNDDDSK